MVTVDSLDYRTTGTTSDLEKNVLEKCGARQERLVPQKTISGGI